MRKRLAGVAVVISIALSLFHLYTGYFGVLVALLQRSVHLLLTMVLVFLLYPASKRHEDHPAVVALDVLLALGSVVCIGYVAGNYDYVVVGEFDDVDSYLTYRDHPDHQAFIAELITGYVAERAAVQFES